MRLVIVGGGIAAQALAEGVRGHLPEAEILILSAETRAPYDRVQLSRLLAGADPESLRLRPATWYEDNRVELRLGAPVAAVDPEAKTVETAAGDLVPYDVLALCTGSSALVPPIPGIERDGSFVFRDPEDCTAILAAAAPGARAAVIGGGLLGLEAARGLVDRGVAVSVVHLEQTLMERQVDGGAGAILARRMSELDVEVLTGRRTVEVTGNGRVDGLRFEDGERLDCDLVVTCIGIRPNVALAAAAGLACERGIVVDDTMRSSDPAIWALGECAQHRGVVYGLVAPIHDQAKVAAAAIAGRAAAYEGSVLSATLKVMGVDLVSAGDALAGGGCTLHDEAAGVYRKLAVREGRAVGAILMGDTRGAEMLLSMVRERRRGGGRRWRRCRRRPGPRRPTSPTRPRSAHCNGVCKGDIRRAVNERGPDRHPRGLRGDARRHRLRQLQGPGRRDRAARDRVGRGGAGLPVRLPAPHPRGRGGHGAREGAALGQRGDGGLRRRTRLRRLQARHRLPGRDDQPEPPRGGAARPVHQRPGAREHPERRHLLGGAAHARRRDQPGGAAPDRRRGRAPRACGW